MEKAVIIVGKGMDGKGEKLREDRERIGGISAIFEEGRQRRLRKYRCFGMYIRAKDVSILSIDL